MLNDQDAINDVNPFVKHEFSLPGSVRQTGDFDNFSKSPTGEGIIGADESVYCSYALCETAEKPTTVFKNIHPRRNIDTGFNCEEDDKVKVGVAKEEQIPYFGIFIMTIFIALVVSIVRR
jgi:hypothetical protein